MPTSLEGERNANHSAFADRLRVELPHCWEALTRGNEAGRLSDSRFTEADPDFVLSGPLNAPEMAHMKAAPRKRRPDTRGEELPTAPSEQGVTRSIQSL